MNTQSTEQITSKKCTACEGGVEKLSADEARRRLEALSGWRLAGEEDRIQKDWEVKSFGAGMEFLNRVAELAEREGHHPDLHLEGYRHVSIVLWTHAIGGLADVDFNLAAKIDELPVRLRK